jgi:Flp pilus assembly protein TadD
MCKRLCLLGAFLFVTGALWCQTPGDKYILDEARLHMVEKTKWNIFGKVTDIHEQPVRAALVIVDLGLGPQHVKQLTTDVQGEFQTQYEFLTPTVTQLNVRLTVRAAGYHDAYEFVNFQNDKTWGIDITLRPASESADELKVESLVETLAPPLSESLMKDGSLTSSRKDLDKGTAAFLDGDGPVAIQNLQKVVDRHPDCGHCRTFLGLAMLQAGSWNGAGKQFVDADKIAQSTGTNADKAESLLIVGEMENWKSEYNKAAGFLMQAKDLDPKNAFILQELGRTLIFQKNWEAADQYLDQATHAGAPKESLLLRVRALLEEGDPATAETVMKEYIGNSSVSGLPPNVRSLNSQVEARLSLQNATEVQSVVTQPLPELIAAVPELKGLEPAASQDELPSILQKTGENVSAFFTGFQNTVSVEQVRQERLGKNGKVKDFQNLKFQYLLMSQPQQGRMELEEYRTNEHGDRTAPSGLDSGFMLTSGFASASLLFHPAYQSGAKFRYLGRQQANGRTLDVVGFAELPDKAEMIERFNTHDASILVVFQGLAWIDPDAYKIVRLRTDLLKPESKIRLERQTTEITYDPVQFKQVASTVWLPSEVAVTVEWAGKRFRNMHRYSNFKLFNTGTEEHVKPVKIAPAENTNQPPAPADQSPGGAAKQ